MNNNKKKSAIAAGVAGIALLAGVGGGSYALWEKSVSVPGDQIVNGNLDIKALGSTWYDVTPNRSDALTDTGVTIVNEQGEPTTGTYQGHTIDLDTWKGVPGDRLVGVIPVDALLEGDNLTAHFSIEGQQQVLENGWTLQYQVLDDKNVPMAPQPGPPNSLVLGRFSSTDNNNNVAELPTLPTTMDNKADAKVAVIATFTGDGGAIDVANPPTLTEAGGTLADLNVKLTQDNNTDGKGGWISTMPLPQ